MILRRTLPYVSLVLVAACESPTPTAPRPAAFAAVVTSLDADRTDSCTDLVIGGSFHNVVVPPSARCILVRSTLTGSLVALEGSSLQTSSNDIAGNVEIESALDVQLSEDIIAGDVVIAQSTGADGTTPSYLVAGVTVTHGDIVVVKNSNISVNLRDNDVLEGSIGVIDNLNTEFSLIANRVARDVRVIANTGPTNKMVRSTIAGHSILCESNDQPFVAAANTAPKLKRQCDVPPEVE
jgi:hypothetical protein